MSGPMLGIDFFDPDPDDYDAWEDCGMMSDGYCSMAGSEWCDFECPRNRPSPAPQHVHEGAR